MAYGTFKLVQYKSTPAYPLSLEELRDYRLELPQFTFVKSMKPSAVIQATRTMFEQLHTSMMRMLDLNSTVYRKQPGIDNYNVETPRNIQGVYLDDLLPGMQQSQKLWTSNYQRLLDSASLQNSRHRLVGTRRFCNLVITIPPDMTLTAPICELLIFLWDMFNVPRPEANQPTHTSLRFYVFTSSILGETAKEKLTHFKSLPVDIRRMLCLVADDISIPAVIAIAKRLQCRPSYDIDLVRDNGKRINRASELYLSLREAWRDNPGSSGAVPLLFSSQPIENDKFERLLTHYCAPVKTGKTFMKNDKELPVTSSATAAHIVQL